MKHLELCHHRYVLQKKSMLYSIVRFLFSPHYYFMFLILTSPSPSLMASEGTQGINHRGRKKNWSSEERGIVDHTTRMNLPHRECFPIIRFHNWVDHERTIEGTLIVYFVIFLSCIKAVCWDFIPRIFRFHIQHSTSVWKVSVISQHYDTYLNISLW